jgi:hypothetical protein
VVNDDLVRGGSGFGSHPHRDAEIFSYVLDGRLSHADSMGNAEALGRGCVQFMSAGTGVTHSEMNRDGETTRFIQIWLTPDRWVTDCVCRCVQGGAAVVARFEVSKVAAIDHAVMRSFSRPKNSHQTLPGCRRGHTPQYGSSTYEKADRHNRLLRLLGGTGAAPAWPSLHSPNAIALHADANVVVSESDGGQQFDLQIGPARQGAWAAWRCAAIRMRLAHPLSFLLTPTHFTLLLPKQPTCCAWRGP